MDDLESVCGLKFGGHDLLGRTLLNALETVSNAGDEIPPREAASIDEALLALLRGAIGSTYSDERSPNNIEVYHRERIRAITRSHLFDPDLCVASIAKAAGLSSSYVHRLFANETKTLGAWIWERRLEAAHRALLQPAMRKRSITEIAYSLGFKDPAHLSRLFKATYGCSRGLGTYPRFCCQCSE